MFLNTSVPNEKRFIKKKKKHTNRHKQTKQVRHSVVCSVFWLWIPVLSVVIMPSDKRDSAKKSDRASGSGSSSRPSATVTSDAVPAVPSTSAGAEVSTASAKEGTVRSSSTSSAKRTSRTGAHVTSKHSAQALSSAPFDTQASFTDMPTLTSDVCDDMFSDEDVSGADRAPLRSPPALFPASRERRQRVRRQDPGWHPQPAAWPYPFFPNFAYPSMAAAGRGAAGFGAGYAPAFGLPTTPMPFNLAPHGIGTNADCFAQSGPVHQSGLYDWPRTYDPHAQRSRHTVSTDQCSMPRGRNSPGSDDSADQSPMPIGGDSPGSGMSGDGNSGLSASIADPHDWRLGAPPEWDQEVPASAFKSLHDALGAHSDVLQVSEVRPEAQSYSERFLGSDFLQQSRPRIVESPLIAKALTSARRRLASPGAARTVAHPGLEIDQPVLGRPVGDLIPPMPSPFPLSAGWTFSSFSERFHPLSVSSSDQTRFGSPARKSCSVSPNNLASLESLAARSLAGVGTLDTLFAALMSALSTPGAPGFSLAMDPDLSAAETLVKQIVLKMQQSAADMATLYSNVVLLRRDHYLASSSLPTDVRALVRSSPIQQPWLFGPAASKLVASAAESASRELALSALSAQSAGRSSASKRRQSQDPRRAKVPRLDSGRQQRPFVSRPTARRGRGGSRQSARPPVPRQGTSAAGSSSVRKNPQ